MNDAFYIGGQIEIRPAVPAATLAGSRYLTDDGDDTESEVIVIVEDGDHSSIVPSAADSETTDPDSILGDVQSLLDLLGADYTYRGELHIYSPASDPPSRVRVVADGERRTAVQEGAEVVYPADYTVPPGPAVLFDPAAARAWLAEPAFEDISRGQVEYNVDTDGVFDPVEDSPADWVERMLRDLAGDQPAAPQVWRTAPGIAIEVVETVGAERYADGGAVLVVEVGGLRAASRWLACKDLARAEYEDGVPSRPQLDAAVEALDFAATTINALVEQHRTVRAAEAATRATLCTIPSLTAQLSLAEVECALRTLAEVWNGDDPHDVLTKRQRRIADWVAALAAAEQAGEPDDDDATDPPGEHPHEHGDYSDVQ